MKKTIMLILILAILTGVLAGCGNGKGNISDRKDGTVTDSPNDADDIIGREDNGNSDNDRDDGILDGDHNGMNDNDKGSENANDGNKDNPVSSSMPEESPAVASQPVTP